MAAVPEVGNGYDKGDENGWTLLAQKHWLKSTKSRKVKSDVIQREIWDVLEQEEFNFHSLLQLESLQLLEKCVVTNQLHVNQADLMKLFVAWLQR